MQAVFTAQDARHKQVPAYALDYFCRLGVIKRLTRGIYQPTAYEPKVEFLWEGLAVVAASIPNGVICLISALCLYELTDQIVREHWIAIDNRAKAVKRPHARIVRMRNLRLGLDSMSLGEHTLRIFDQERTVVDAFRLLDLEVAIKALRAYLERAQGHKPDIQKLQAYAQILRVDITPYLIALTTKSA